MESFDHIILGTGQATGIPCKEYRRVVLVHPTVSELMPWILDGLGEARQEID